MVSLKGENWAKNQRRRRNQSYRNLGTAFGERSSQCKNSKAGTACMVHVRNNKGSVCLRQSERGEQ